MVESLDFEIGRLLNNLPTDVRDNTLIIYVGDNGTPNTFLQDYPNGHGKGSAYQGGIRVPMIVAGKGVTRQGERETALVHVSDIYATILEAVGAELDGGIYNSLSFHHLLTGDAGATRDYNYSETVATSGDTIWTIRNQQYKLMDFGNNTQEFYDLLVDSLEFDNLLLGNLTTDQQLIKDDLQAEAIQIRTAWSCRDHIKNGDEIGIDCGGSFCADCTTSTIDPALTKSKFNIFPNPAFDELNISSEDQQIESIQVFDLMGQLVFEKNNIGSTNFNFDISQLNTQLYLIQIGTKDKIESKRFVKL